MLRATDPMRSGPDTSTPGRAFSTGDAKATRHRFPDKLAAIREGIELSLQSVRKTVAILPQIEGNEVTFDLPLKDWHLSNSDFSDAHLVAMARRAGIPRIISDDADLASFAGIRLYTANPAAIEAARDAGRLLA